MLTNIGERQFRRQLECLLRRHLELQFRRHLECLFRRHLERLLRRNLDRQFSRHLERLFRRHLGCLFRRHLKRLFRRHSERLFGLHWERPFKRHFLAQEAERVCARSSVAMLKFFRGDSRKNTDPTAPFDAVCFDDDYFVDTLTLPPSTDPVPGFRPE